MNPSFLFFSFCFCFCFLGGVFIFNYARLLVVHHRVSHGQSTTWRSPSLSTIREWTGLYYLTEPIPLHHQGMDRPVQPDGAHPSPPSGNGQACTTWRSPSLCKIREWTGLEFAKSQRAVENGGTWRKPVAKSSVVPQRPLPTLAVNGKMVMMNCSPKSNTVYQEIIPPPPKKKKKYIYINRHISSFCDLSMT